MLRSPHPPRPAVVVSNVFEPSWDLERDEAPYRWRRAFVGRQAGARDLGASLFEVAPGGETFPLHAHLANEELLVVLAGRPTLRTADGDRELTPGEVVAFPAGPAHPHGLRNDTAEPVRVLMVSTMRAPDVNVFPETGELWVRDYVPGTDPPPDAFDVRAKT
ncbi:MAG: cupin domain-containing protein [Solirubrobacterales bacterium]|nr:cupin domain-containing protein [Solirubrobacterales bacterium]